MVFIVDSSGSICDQSPSIQQDGAGNTIDCEYWRLITGFLTQIVDDLVIGENDGHIGLIRFSGSSEVIMTLNR